MIEHLLLLRWTEGTSPEAVDAALAELRALKDKIPGILDLSCGMNFSARAKGFTHGLVIRFKDWAAQEAYNPHPEHQRVVQKFINPIRGDTIVLDYEF
jgi:hypothetical protein